MKLSYIRTVALGATMAVTTSLSASWAQEVLRFGHVYEASTPYHTAAERAAELLEKATEGRYTMESSRLRNSAKKRR
ncbi:hypothetical protein [Shimia sp. R11_0]|uniref:hypothetical protein n=1 Tax=Shimia sp. R11_0 TaxID=2821096 RepID=UPI001FFDFBAF|nr:hypothetical protein [Shimia sp. R11_0]